MKKLNPVLVFCLLFMPAVVFSQEVTSSEKEGIPEYVYCEIVGSQKMFTTRINVVVNFGQKLKVFDNRLRDNHGRLREFNSMIDALNYMSRQGWEFVQAFSVTPSNDYSEYHYLLKRKFDDLDAEAKQEYRKE